MSKDEQDTVVGLHNEKRAKVANGDETKGRGKQQPGAANMMELVKYSKVQAVYNIIRERMNGTLVCWLGRYFFALLIISGQQGIMWMYRVCCPEVGNCKHIESSNVLEPLQGNSKILNWHTL